MNVRIRHLGKRFGTTPVLRGVDLEIEDREFFFLLGPSGCGKTTLLRILAGFYEPDEGEVWFGERRMNGIEPHKRNTGMVFQNYALWPHLSVAENVAYGLDVRSVSATEKRDRVREALAIVRMDSFGDRSPNQLSGGQQQRVALARALVVRPDVLLLDEPLSNLDARLRLEMRDEIRRIHEKTRVTTVYVTHDQKEALSMADRMAVLRGGVVEQIGKPRDLYRSPANRFVAEFIGEMNWLPGTVESVDDEAVHLRTPVGRWTARRARDAQGGAEALTTPGRSVHVGFRPEAVRFAAEGVANVCTTTIDQVTYLGETEQYLLRVAEGLSIKAIEPNPEAIRDTG
ncbi:MAG: ABC transporter ATP-binding protein, partial [Verrucomicrobiales bacterium]|nr:ABC transporter ATP-binding protein [Verrucomicrobiales bacterium]